MTIHWKVTLVRVKGHIRPAIFRLTSGHFKSVDIRYGDLTGPKAIVNTRSFSKAALPSLLTFKITVFKLRTQTNGADNDRIAENIEETLSVANSSDKPLCDTADAFYFLFTMFHDCYCLCFFFFEIT